MKLNVSIEQQNLKRLEDAYQLVSELQVADGSATFKKHNALNELRHAIKHSKSLVHKASQ